MLFYFPQALYERSNGYTGTSLYENWSLTVLNTLFTSLCVIVPGIFEQDLKAEVRRIETNRLQSPKKTMVDVLLYSSLVVYKAAPSFETLT